MTSIDRNIVQGLVRACDLAKSKRQKVEALRLLKSGQWLLCGRDPWYFISEFCITRDEHDKETPYKKVPRKECNELYVQTWHREPLLLVPKSRQVMVSWLTVMCYLWDAMYHQGRLEFFQSKKEEDADKLVQRGFGVWERLPDWMREEAPAESKYCNVSFPKQDSLIQGIPQGENQIRSNTASGWFGDEAAFQPEFGAAVAAANPAIEGGGRATIVSSARASVMFEMVDVEPVPGSRKVLIDPGWRPNWSPKWGMHEWRTQQEWAVLELHYSADPDKNEAWARKAASKYRGGLEGKDWQAEMEIDPGAKAGKRVIPHFTRATHVIPQTDIPPEWPRFRGIDPGFNNPCAVVWVALNSDGEFIVYDMLYVRQMDIPKVATLIKSRAKQNGKIEFTKIGHDAGFKTQVAGGETIADQYFKAGILVDVAYTKVEPSIQILAKLCDVQEHGEPKFKVMENCHELIWELENWRYPELTEQQTMTQSDKEQPIKKNDHAIDAIRNVVCNIPETYLEDHNIRDPLEDVKYTTLSQRARRRFLESAAVTVGGTSEEWD